VVFNPSVTVAGLSEHLWRLGLAAHTAANGYFMGAVNRVRIKEPWGIDEFYSSSYFANPKGQIIAEAKMNS